ncbi:MAG: glycosyltransferase family 87 protein, partial [Anaerolineaceae bacterium]|nr:glycosyltransferase family 87 protein [Anaerolineaceae bacterium]
SYQRLAFNPLPEVNTARHIMTKARLDGLLLLLLGSAMFVLSGAAMEHIAAGSMQDFKGIYYSTRCLLEHCDPYSQDQLLHVFLAEGGEHVMAPAQRQVVTLCVYFPTVFIFLAPFAVMAWGPAHLLWMILTAASLIVAAYLIWSLGANEAPRLSGVLIGLLLVFSAGLMLNGNSAGIAVSLCVIAVWCFLRERFVWAGVLCLAASLAIKPHDAGLVWLYFLLAGGVMRKRALQTLAITALLGLPAVLWVSQVSPHWLHELQYNQVVAAAHGGLSDPRPDAVGSGTAAMMTNLQTVFSMFWDDARVYDLVTYCVCGALLLVWVVITLRSEQTRARTWLALAAIAALSMLPVYHRPHDARLLLLTIPACAILWAEGAAIRWFALALNFAGIVLTGDLPLALLVHLVNGLHMNSAGMMGRALTIVLTRPAPLILTAIGVFYLWVYVKHCGNIAQDQS